MSSLTYSKTESGLEVIIAPNGAAYCTQSSYSRWIEVPQQTISDRSRKLEILTVSGLEAATDFPVAGQLIRTSITGIPVIDSKVGGQGIPADERGTWAIEEVAIDFAAWCNVKFRVWVSQQIKTLMTTGTVSIAPTDHQLPATYLEALKALVEGEEEKERLRVQNELQASQIEDLEEDVVDIHPSLKAWGF